MQLDNNKNFNYTTFDWLDKSYRNATTLLVSFVLKLVEKLTHRVT